jgi:hypothetical protein
MAAGESEWLAARFRAKSRRWTLQVESSIE